MANIIVLACSKVEIIKQSVLEYILLLPCADSFKHDKIETICLLMSDVQYFLISASQYDPEPRHRVHAINFEQSLGIRNIIQA